MPEITSTDYMRQIKKKEEDLPALKIALTHQNNDSKIDCSHQKQYWQHEDQQSKNN